MKAFALTILLFSLTLSLKAQNYTVSNYTSSTSGLIANNINAIKGAAGGVVWIGTNGSGLSKFDGTIWTTYTTTQGLAGNTVKGIDIDQSGNIWIATSTGLSMFNGSTFTNYTTAQGLPTNDLRCVFIDNSDTPWVGTSGSGVSEKNGALWTTYTTAQGLAQNFVQAITQDGSNNMWFATAVGVSRFTGSVWTTFTSSNGLIANGDEVISAETDHDGNVWFGSRPGMGIGGGISMYNGSSWTTYNNTNGLANNEVRGISCDAQNRFWFSTYVNGASHFRNGTFATYSTPQGLVSATQQCVDVAPSGEVWIGTAGGVSCIRTIVYQSSLVGHNYCGNTNSGTITVTAGTINAPMYFSIDNGVTYQTSNTFSGLASGFYNIWMTDSSMFMQGPGYNIQDIPAAELFAIDSVEICLYDSVQLNPDASFTNFDWSPDSVVSSASASNPYIFPEVDQYVTVMSTDSNACMVEDSVYFSMLPYPVFTVNTTNDSVFSIVGAFDTYQWFWYGDSIVGATTQTYTATQPGIYTVCVTNAAGCSACSGMLHYQNTSIDESSVSMHLYADHGLLYYDLPEENCTISLYTYDGRLIEQFVVDSKTGFEPMNAKAQQVILIHVQGSNTQRWVKVFAQ